MKTDPVRPEDLRRSVISVPPLARRADLSFDEGENRKILAHMRAGGVSTFMYGGNANLYHMGVREYAPFLEMLQRLAQAGDWMLPSIGSDFGKAMDQAAIAKDYPFPSVMVLPHRFPIAVEGVATGLRRIADAYGKPIVAYVKDLGYVEPKDLGRLARDGAIAAIKYAIVRENPSEDRYLHDLLGEVDPALVISGIGERPVIAHWNGFGIRAFTSGSVCVGPALSNAIRLALQAGDTAQAERLRARFMPLEDLRDAHSPMRVLHAAVRLAGIADTGALLPFMAAIEDQKLLDAIGSAARDLKQENDGHLAKAA
ncbi:MAG TPA: dihydrodipicolinate synthase family protein [Beijerinckiaceae bacterium]|nr:dihydrodipicolinate synthase family protein [Beijerinckiaceae bacterium]